MEFVIRTSILNASQRRADEQEVLSLPNVHESVSEYGEDKCVLEVFWS